MEIRGNNGSDCPERIVYFMARFMAHANKKIVKSEKGILI